MAKGRGKYFLGGLFRREKNIAKRSFKPKV
jgi:hypothetical protein